MGRGLEDGSARMAGKLQGLDPALSHFLEPTKEPWGERHRPVMRIALIAMLALAACPCGTRDCDAVTPTADESGICPSDGGANP